MTDNNGTPQNTDVTETSTTGLIASRWDRLWAALIDIALSTCAIIPIVYFTGGFDGIFQGAKKPLSYNLLISAINIIIFIILNGKLLVNYGQTIGKKIIGIKIVDLNGNLPTIKHHLLKRYAFVFIAGEIPVLGKYLPLVDVLFIFGSEKRCLHDFIAGTKVVNC